MFISGSRRRMVIKQGQFEAAEFLVTPKTQQVITGGVDYNVSKETSVTADVARSRYDVNTLSTKDKDNDAGSATKLTLQNLHLIKSVLPGWVISSYLNYEYNDIRFHATGTDPPGGISARLGSALAIAEGQ